MGDFIYTENRKSRKERKCDLCGKLISVGEEYHINKGVFEGAFFDSKECLLCQPVISEYLENGAWENSYCTDELYDWWRDAKCYSCKYYYPLCKPDDRCSAPNECNWFINGRCKADDTCGDMTHYCRCEKYENG